MTSNETITPEFLSRTEVATWLSLHPGTLANMAARGCGPKFVRTGHLQGRALYRREDVLAWLESNVEGRNAKAVSLGNQTSSVEAASAPTTKRGSRRHAKCSDAVSSTSVSRGRTASSIADETTQRATATCHEPRGRRKPSRD
jgi:hypothetical protein